MIFNIIFLNIIFYCAFKNLSPFLQASQNVEHNHHKKNEISFLIMNYNLWDKKGTELFSFFWGKLEKEGKAKHLSRQQEASEEEHSGDRPMVEV